MSATTGDPTCDGLGLLSRLNALFDEDPAIDEIGLLFDVDAETLGLDNAFVLAEHKLGVAFAAGPLLFRAARTRFHELNGSLPWTAEEQTANSIVPVEYRELLLCTRAIVLISADFYTAWNTRKWFVSCGWLRARDEVAFTNLVFTLHPKSIDTWAYRRWLATRLFAELNPDELEGFVVEQLEICSTLAERFPRNYHAWSFRHWIVSKMNLVALERELEAMRHWCERHLTDHSGWNHRQHTITCLLRAQQLGFSVSEAVHKQLVVVANEFAFLSSILSRYPVHEALWCHRRFVFQKMGRLLNVSGNSEEQCSIKAEGLIKTFSLQVPKETHQPDSSLSWAIQEDEIAEGRVGLLRYGLEEIVVSWLSGQLHGRRYAVWVVERLIAKLDPEMVEDRRSLNELEQAMRSSLATSDPILAALWSR